MSSQGERGFTLIELLVVIAIIGILASIVLASLSQARDRGRDASIRASMSQMRAQAEMYFDANRATFDPVPAGGDNVCVDATNTLDLDVLRIAAQAQAPTVNDYECNASTASWAADITLNSGGNYCVDHTGFSGKRTTDLGTGIVCPAT